MVSPKTIIYLIIANLTLSCLCHGTLSPVSNTHFSVVSICNQPDYKCVYPLSVIYSLHGGKTPINEKKLLEEDNEFIWDLVDKRDKEEESAPQKVEGGKTLQLDYDSEEEYSAYTKLSENSVNKYSPLSDTVKDNMIKCLIQKHINDRCIKQPTNTSSDYREKRNYEMEKTFPQMINKNNWIRNKKITHILPVIFNPKNMWKMIRMYWVSLFDVYYLDHNISDKYSYNSHISSTIFPSIGKTRTRQKRGQSKKLSDLPRIT